MTSDESFGHAAAVLDQVQRRFQYTSDANNPALPESEVWRFGDGAEHWPTRAQVMAQGLLSDDCDGHAIACWHLLRDRGVKARLVECLVRVPSGVVGHLVCATEDGWVLDNMHPRAVMGRDELKRMGYTFTRMSGFNPSEDWRLTE